MQINYEDVTGIKVHSEVRYAGAPAGRVIAMRHLSATERDAAGNKKDAVRVTVSLDDGIPPLPADVIATLSSDTMLAPKFVALSAGTPGGKTLANNAMIEGHPSYGIEQITAAAGPLFDNANKLIDNLSATVTNVNGTVTERERRSREFPAETFAPGRHHESGISTTCRRRSKVWMVSRKLRTHFLTRQTSSSARPISRLQIR